MTVTTPYMDEIFHIPQTWELCLSWREGRDTKWDGKITTPPGLYYAAVLLTGGRVCDEQARNGTIFWLRATSALFWVGTFYVTRAICIRRGAEPISANVTAWLAFTLPPGFFFSSMFYTDAGSVFFVLLGWLACLRDQPPHQFFKRRMQEPPPSWIPKPSKIVSALACTMAMYFRQTNIVWVCFVMGSCAVTRLERHNLKSLRDLIVCIRHEFWHICMELWPLLLTTAVFVLQLLLHMSKTGGAIVLGDQSNHMVTPHLAQLCYFCVFACFASGAAWDLRLSMHAVTKTPIKWLLVVSAVFGICVGGFTVTHPFLLADNRHFTFYVWSKFLRRHEWNKFLLIPIYTWSFLVLVLETAKTVTVSLESIGFMVCLAASLVPLPLVEPRYFITPCIVLLILMSKRPLDKLAYVAVCLNVICISVVGGLFWFKPFTWVDGTIARFMW